MIYKSDTVAIYIMKFLLYRAEKEQYQDKSYVYKQVGKYARKIIE